ncbi:C-type lectin domain family 2 member E-like [Peromyscus eremicus]|uniref:C-type lectin domain family 2 member E-like n=1 Tax=Peromyscus eremicus TaxID=42410 RepID=UPI0027DB33FE|nr:C-type lectin domain family 2 member E-like [Peromyscus eremicus]
MKAAKAEEASIGMLETDFPTPGCLQEVEIGKKLQEVCLRILSPESPAKLYCSYALNIILTAVVIALSVALSVRTEKPVISTPGPCYATCPNDWIGFGSKCFYFSEDMGNWTFSQSSCMEEGAQLAQFDSLDELNFLKRCTSVSDCWIGLWRESKQHPWKWTENTEYNNLVPVEGEEKHAYLTSSGIISSKDSLKRRWVCSKSNSYTSQYSVPGSF